MIIILSLPLFSMLQMPCLCCYCTAHRTKWAAVNCTRARTCLNVPPPPAFALPCPQNFFLYFYGMCFNLVGLLLFMAGGALTPATMFAGFKQVG